MRAKKIEQIIDQALSRAQLDPKQTIPQDTLLLQTQIAAKQQIIDAQIATQANSKKNYWNQWINLNNWANYFANRFKYDTTEPKHNITINQVLRNGFIFGQCGVWNNNGTPTLINIQEIDYATNKAKFTIFSPNPDPAKKPVLSPKNPKGQITKPADQVINYQFDSTGLTAFIKLEPVLRLEEFIQKALAIELSTLPTRLIHESQNSNTNLDLIRQIIELETPVVSRVAGGTDEFTGLSFTTNTQGLTHLIEVSKNWYYDILGRSTNTDFKKAHTLEQEAINSQANIQALEWDRYLYFKDFIIQYATLFNLPNTLIENYNGAISHYLDPLMLEPTNIMEEQNKEEKQWD